MKSIVSILFSLVVTSCYGQYENTKTSYKKLQTLSVTSKSRGSYSKCKPCIIEEFDESGILKTKSIQYEDCFVGFYNEYYPSGKVKTTGQYKENPTEDWNNIYDRGYCLVKTGEWVYYEPTGKKSYKEYWQNGNFLNQIPERPINEAWKFELMLNGHPLKHGEKITAGEIKKVQAILLYKNKSSNRIAYTFTLEINANKTHKFEEAFSPAGFLTNDIYNYIIEKELIKEDTYFSVTVRNEKTQRIIWGRYFKIKIAP